MGISREQAYHLLDLPVGAGEEEIDENFIKLIENVHPSSSNLCIPMFKNVVWAYQRLKVGIEDTDMSLNEMVRLGNRVRSGLDPFSADGPSDEDEDDDENVYPSQYFYDMLLHRMLFLQQHSQSDFYSRPQSHLSLADIETNARELVQEEEMEKLKAENKRAKKKRQREKKRLEKLAAQEISAGASKGVASKSINGDLPCPTLASSTPIASGSSESIAADKNRSSQAATKFQTRKRGKKLIEKFPATDNRSAGASKGVTATPIEVDDNDKRNENDDIDCELPDIDASSAFFSNALKKIPTASNSDESLVVKKKKAPQIAMDAGAILLKSRKLAIEGNGLVKEGLYAEAAVRFTQAIALHKQDYRYFGNRSICFDHLEEYDRALQDAEMAIILSPHWATGHFRKGRALIGLNLVGEAEQAFLGVLRIEGDSKDAKHELEQIKVRQIMEMGFSEDDALEALGRSPSTQAAIDTLLSRDLKTSSINASGGNAFSRRDGASRATAGGGPSVTAGRTAGQRDSESDGDECKSLWIGNVQSGVTASILTELFSRCGQVDSVHRPPGVYYAFVNYTHPSSASAALVDLQGVECYGEKLRLKVPDHHQSRRGRQAKENKATTAVDLPSPARLPEVKAAAAAAGVKAAAVKASGVKAATAKVRVNGPVNGDECYFWRTTGCTFGSGCRNRHVPQHRAIDRD